jgi:oligopeptide/dipeptide ABC transporter, ATP-binding protein, C-terminal domain
MTRSTSDNATAIEIAGLNISLRKAGIKLVRDVSLSVRRGETLALVGESGSGKSLTSMAILGLLPKALQIEGSITLDPGSDEAVAISGLGPSAIRTIRGNRVAMVFQEPMTSLDPLFTIGDQIEEALRLHLKLSRRGARARALELLTLVGISDPEQRLSAYPHELSGGMRQRVMIAIALSCDPDVLIADEPTTALDVTIQAQILDLIQSLQARLGMAVIFVSHDLGVVAEIADRVAVMYSGRVVEAATTDEVFNRPAHPYTGALLRSAPQIFDKGERPPSIKPIRGIVPDPVHRPSGCAFRTRCDHAVIGLCDVEDPPEISVSGGHLVRCLRALEVMEQNVVA